MKTLRGVGSLLGALFALSSVQCSSADRPGPGGLGSDTGLRDAGVDGRSGDSAVRPEGSIDGAADASLDGKADAGQEGGGTGQGDADASTGDAPVDSGTPADAGGGFPPPPAAVCHTNTMWAPGLVMTVSTGATDALDAIAPDELSVVWTQGAGANASIEYADRTTTASAFAGPKRLNAGSFAVDRAAISPDGLRLVLVSSDGQSLVETVRTARTGPGSTFGAPSMGSYANLDAPGALATGQSYGDPVLSADDHFFYYSVFGAGATATVYRSARIFGTDPWPPGAPVASTADLQAQGALRRRPTAISSDGQTLFFWDDVSATERAAWIDEITGSFDFFVDLGARAMAAPDTACDRLYYSAQGTSSEDLFVADAGP